MPKHLYAVPVGLALPDPAGQPEGLPYVLDDGTGKLTLYAIHNGAYAQVAAPAAAAAPSGAPMISGLAAQLASGQLPITPANNSYIHLIPTSVFGMHNSKPPVEAYYADRGGFAFGASDGAFAVHFDITVTGFSTTDAAAAAQVNVPTGAGTKFSPLTKPNGSGNVRIDMDYVLKGVSTVLYPQLYTVFGAGSTPTVDSWNLEIVPLVAAPTTPPTVHSIDTDPASVVPVVTSTVAGTVHVTWGNLAGAAASDSIEVRVETQPGNGSVISNYTAVVAGNATSADVTGVPSGRVVAVSIQRTRTDLVPATRDFAGHVTVA